MKKMIWIALLVCCFSCVLSGRAGAVDLQLQQQESVDAQALEDAAPDVLKGTGVFDFSDFGAGLSLLGDTLADSISSLVRGSVRSGALLLLIVFFCGLAETVGSVGTGAVRSPVRLAGAGAVSLVALSDMSSLIGLGRETIQQLSTFVTILIPTMTTAAAASGAVASAPVRQAVTLLFSNFLTRLITAVLLPLTYAYAAVSVGSAALGTPRLKPLAKLLRWVIVTALTGAMLAYTGYLTVSGAVSSTADATAVRAAQLAISGMVPVVGSILSDATETVFSGAALLRNSVGIFGMIGVLGFCAVPFLRLGLQFLLYKLVSALSATASDHPVSELIQELGNVFALVMAMTGSCALVALLSLVATISAVVP